MTQFIPMPWDERAPRWSDEEVAAGLRLKAGGLDYREVADALAEAGFPPRDETDVSYKLRAKVDA